MKKNLVVYYSNTGSNKYLANRIAGNLACDIAEIRPRPNVFPLLLLFSSLKRSMGIKALDPNPGEYERIILCGPVWMGKLISPLRDFLFRYRNGINNLYVASCCASSDAAKDDKFGHGLVFNLVREIMGDKCVHCEAFPIGLVVPEDKKEDSDTIMKTRLSDENFSGEILLRFEKFIQLLAK